MRQARACVVGKGVETVEICILALADLFVDDSAQTLDGYAMESINPNNPAAFAETVGSELESGADQQRSGTS
jgi:hypothetical protein